MSAEPQRTCPSCGKEFSAAMEFCPVCALRKALADGVESGEASASEDTVKPTTSEQAVQRFEHYELVKGEDGKPVELGRGAMGVTYKAFDINLRCPVTLKVISERYLSDESGVWGATEQKTGLSTGCRQPLDRRDVNIERLGAVPYILSLVQLVEAYSAQPRGGSAQLGAGRFSRQTR